MRNVFSIWIDNYVSIKLVCNGKCFLREAFNLYFFNFLSRIEMTGIRKKVEAVIEEIRPNLQADGGDIELVDVEEGVAKVKLKGACAGCPMSTMTVKWGVENFLKKKVPEITRVETV